MIKIKEFEFSKWILIVAYLTGLVFTSLTVWLAIAGGDAASFANIVLAIWALVSTAVGFYFWKAKAENLIKIAKAIPHDKVDDLDEIKAFVE